MSSIQRKAYPVELKTLDDAKGTVEALVSVFNNVDLIGDRVVPGAFKASIDKWKDDGRPVPVVFSHKWDDPWAHIGVVDEMEETEQGLKARYTLDVDDNPLAAHIYRLMKRGSLKEHSFAYDVVKERTAKGGVNELVELDVIEVGPTLKGMNPDTELLAVKAIEEAQAKAGRSLSKANEAKLRSAVTAITEVLSSLGSADDDEKQDPPPEPVESQKDADEAEASNGKASDGYLLALRTQIESLREGVE